MNNSIIKPLLSTIVTTALLTIGGVANASLEDATEEMSKEGHGTFVHFMEVDGVIHAPWNDRIENFDAAALADVAEAGGASYLLFTLTHHDFNLPFPLPNSASDNLKNIFSGEGRQADRDLMSDLYDELNSRGIKLYFYINIFADSESPEFKDLWGYPNGNWLNNVYELIEVISLEYGTKVSGWWIENMDLTAKPGGRDVDRVLLAEKLRAGNPDAVLAYNVRGQQTGQIPFANDAAIADIVEYTGGHLKDKDLNYLKPVSKFDNGGLLNHRVEPIDNSGWWLDELPEDAISYFHHPRYAMDSVLEYMKDLRSVGAVMTWNMAPYADGSIDPRTAGQMKIIGQVMRKGKEYVANASSHIDYVNFNANVSQTWNSDRSIAYSSAADGSATFSFEGAQVELWAKKSADAGDCEVFIDGVSQGTHDQFNSTNLFEQKVFDSGLMPSGNHTFQLKTTSEGVTCHLDHILYTPALATKLDGAVFNFDSGWKSKSRSTSYGGTIHYSSAPDVSASYTFTGDKFQLYTQAGPSAGAFTLLVDGEEVAVVDTYRPTYVHQQLAYASETMVPGEHTITITTRANSNPASSGSFVHIDYIQVNETLPNGYVIDANHHDVTYDAGWVYQEEEEAFSNTVYYSEQTNAAATYSFNGSGIAIYSRLGANHGQCGVTIDGNVVEVVDTYGPSHEHRAKIFEDQNLSAGNHTIAFYPTGTNHANSDRYYCVLDRFEVTP